MAGEDAPKLYCTDEDRDGDWNGAIADPAVVDDAWRQWRAEVELTDQFVASVADLGTRNAGVSDLGPDGADVQLRDILVAQIAEYARHCGHADLLRERIDAWANDRESGRRPRARNGRGRSLSNRLGQLI
jgi:hypothetical protein